jgi:hypothetical protein
MDSGGGRGIHRLQSESQDPVGISGGSVKCAMIAHGIITAGERRGHKIPRAVTYRMASNITEADKKNSVM